MELKQLTALVTVADVGSITKSARLLHIVQPAVTRQIKALEDEMGVALFDRTRHGMVPTAAGKLLVERARRALLELERGRAEIRPEAGEVSGIVTVGVLESVIELVVPRLVARVRTRYPGVQLRMVAAYSGHLQQWLADGDVDVSLLYNMADTPSLTVVPVIEESLWAVGPPGAELDPERPITWREALRHPMVMPVPGHGLRALIEQARSLCGAESPITIEANSMQLQKRLVLCGCGWTILPPAGIATDVASGALTGAPLIEPKLNRSLVMGLPRGGQTPAAVQMVSIELIKTIRRLAKAGEWPSAVAEGSAEW